MDDIVCPVCDRMINVEVIERHVNNCLFLNSSNDSPASKKRKENAISPTPLKTSRFSTQSFSGSSVTISEPSISPNSSLPEAGTGESADPQAPIKSYDVSIGISSISDSLQAKRTNIAESNTMEERKYSFEIPLAEALRPSAFADFVGQDQTVGSGSVLRKLLDNADIPSLILWGPPGCGKTTLANVIKEILIHRGKASGSSARFVKLHATMAGVGDVKEMVKVAKNELRVFKRRTIIFMDEIHRFNKSQQDAFLPHIESGIITLIGATTENPSFSLNSALLSRCRVIPMDKLSIENVERILHRAVKFVGGRVTHPESDSDNEPEKDQSWIIDHDTIEWLSQISDGDARIALNSLQMAFQSKSDCKGCITLNDIKDSIKKSHILYDKKGDEHYNLISAVHKSIRASDDNAALYWVIRMLHGGEDPIFIARRLVRAAAEDIGIADPNALVLAVSTMHGCQQIGMPECDVLLAELAVYLARCPKSTEVYKAMNRAKSFIAEQKGPMPAVPLHLRNAPTKLMKNLGYGQKYNKQHKSVSGLEYMPEGLEHVNFFKDDS